MPARSKKLEQVPHTLGQDLANFGTGEEYLQLTVSRETGEQVEAKVPARAVHFLAHILDEMEKGNSITLLSQPVELSTIQAAEIMRISCPHLIKLLEEGAIPFHFVGTHRRIHFDDLQTYMERQKAQRKEALKELMAEQEHLGLYE